ncbi:hypothetical protein T4A_7614 [Trichinella pseudospiralis]|uniref:Uncharacterized protein n=1 Tax=Trichinella pseudospiralis TaxID=6337 RepID=A0A0V1E1K6_TRIPS|nr:hypothetical protein T4A_7614 [Trichinella pseudospiralis]
MVNLSICDNNVVKMKRTLIILPYFMYALRLMRCLSQQQPTSIACLLLTGVVRHTKYKISKRKILLQNGFIFQLTISQIRNTAHVVFHLICVIQMCCNCIRNQNSELLIEGDEE